MMGTTTLGAILQTEKVSSINERIQQDPAGILKPLQVLPVDPPHEDPDRTIKMFLLRTATHGQEQEGLGTLLDSANGKSDNFRLWIDILRKTIPTNVSLESTKT